MGETIEQFIASGSAYEAYCQACHHHAPLDMRAMRDRLGPDHGALYNDIVHLLKCSRCGGKEVGLIRSPKGNKDRFKKHRWQ